MEKRIYSTLSIVVGVFMVSLGALMLPGFSIEQEEDEGLFWEQFEEPLTSFEIDLDGDGEEERGEMKDGIAYVIKGDEIIFQSDEEWYVQEIIVGDFDNDGQNDFGLSLWKEGNYGNSKPFWVEENDDSYGMHLFLYTWKRDEIAPLWHSSNLPKVNVRVRLFDIDNDERNELVVLERNYEKSAIAPDYFAVWRWWGWGFELLYREPLSFHRDENMVQ